LMTREGRSKAKKLLQDAVALADRLSIDFRRDPKYRRVLGRSLYNLAEWHLRNLTEWDFDIHSDEKAQETLLRAKEIWEELAARPGTPDDKHMLGETLHNLAWLHKNRKNADAEDMEKAVGYLRQAVVAQKAAWDTDKKNGIYRNELCLHFHLLAETLLKKKQHEAVDETVTHLVSLFPDDPEQKYKAAGYLARCVPLAGKNMAERYANEAIDHLKFAVDKHPRAAFAIAEAHRLLGTRTAGTVGLMASPLADGPLLAASSLLATNSNFFHISAHPAFKNLLDKERARKQK
jgi:tetratricopeptide (TPR) repeat protein